MPALAFDFLCSVFKEHCLEGARSLNWTGGASLGLFRRSPTAGRNHRTFPFDPRGPFGAASQITCSSGLCQQAVDTITGWSGHRESALHGNKAQPVAPGTPPQPLGPAASARVAAAAAAIALMGRRERYRP
jgi:hypothetical protein